MTEAEFDKYAEDYYRMLKSSITKSGEEPEFFAEYKILAVRVVIAAYAKNQS